MVVADTPKLYKVECPQTSDHIGIIKVTIYTFPNILATFNGTAVK